MLDPTYRYPGGGKFVAEVAAADGSPTMEGAIGRLPPVQYALARIEAAASCQEPEVRGDLLESAHEQIRILRAGISVIVKAAEHVAQATGDPVPETFHAARPAGLPIRDGGRPTEGDIRSAPIDTDALGVTGSAKPPGWDAQQAAAAEAQRIETSGVDEGVSGGPKRPDTGVNQSFNQLNVATQYDQAPVGPNTFEGNPEPPWGEPHGTDKGVGVTLKQEGPTDGSGLNLASQKAALGESPVPEDFGQPPSPEAAPVVKARGRKSAK